MARPALVALDWGTTSLRAYLLGEGGEVLARREGGRGVMQVEKGGFPAEHAAILGDWAERHPDLRSLACGMVGSTSGWVEAPYAECPAGPEDVARSLASVPGHGLLIVPGVAQRGDAPDVMRGEEVQIFGALELHPELRAGRARIVHPGTHSKWITVEGGRIASFRTFLTGELFAVLRAHSILGRFDTNGTGTDWASFARGVEAVRRAGGNAAPLLFSARSLVLTGGLAPEGSLDYLSGLLIGEEICCAAPSEPPLVVGDSSLCEHYLRAFEISGLGRPPFLDGAEALAAGLWRVASLAGLVGERAAAR